MPPKRNRAGRPRLATDDEIFDAVTDVISEYGPQGASMTRIAERLGLTGPALAHRFGNKRNLLLAFAKHQPSVVQELLAKKRASHPEPLELVVEFYVALVSPMTSKKTVANNIAMLNLDLTDRALGRHARLHARAIRRCTAELLAEAEIKDARDVADELYTVWSGAILTWAIDGEGTLGAWLRRHLCRVLARQTGQPLTPSSRPRR